jgi:hypothetical protein
MRRGNCCGGTRHCAALARIGVLRYQIHGAPPVISGMPSFRKPVPTFRERAETCMIALTAGRRKGVVNTRETVPDARHCRKPRFTGSLAESYCCPTSANRPPRWVAKRKSCVGPVLSVPDSSAPSPPGPSGSGLFAEGVNPDTGPTKVGPFSFVGPFEHRCIRRVKPRLPQPASVQKNRGRS